LISGIQTQEERQKMKTQTTIRKPSFLNWRMTVRLLALGITIAGVAAVALFGTQSISAESAAVAPEIEGTWLATVTIPDGPPPFPSLLTYAAGGALIATDSSVPPANGNVYQGTWTKTGPHKFAFTFLGFQYDANGVLTNYFRARETLQIERGGNAYSGVTTIEILDLSLNVIATSSSTTHAVRLTAQ
jgi:hypothetical protein